MKLEIRREDPLNILSSTKSIVEDLNFLSINESKLDPVSRRVIERLKTGLESLEEAFGTTGSYIDDVQLIFIEDTLNFCFWAEKDRPKWSIEWPAGQITSGGWYSLKKCFERALANNIPILDADYLSNLTLDSVREFFKGINNIEIPLISRRLENLIEAGSILKEKYNGHFINVLKESDYDAIKLVKIIYGNFPSSRDTVNLDGKEVYFLKRAQICANDLSYLSKEGNGKAIKNLDLLTAFSDYKLPQIFRAFGVFEYSRELSEMVDDYTLIPAGSRQEIEIRSAAIWAVELIRQRLAKYNSCEIDNALWLISQNQSGLKPHHRTYTIFY
ncbi:MAG: queuosine salvage family protein [bacterium]|nr:queuosine salvage family protein [bacterium]